MFAAFWEVEADNGAPRHIGLWRALAAASGLAVICTAPAAAADWDPAAMAPGLRMPDPLFSLRDMYPDLAARSVAAETSREFHPHSSAYFARSPDAGLRSSGVMDSSGDLAQTSAWQRLRDFRSDEGIRLLTVWQTTDSTIALLQGKHGGASLQWTSHSLNRGGASRGLLDHLFSAVHGVRVPVRASASNATAPAPPASRIAAP
jgi:hypothetical protein